MNETKLDKLILLVEDEDDIRELYKEVLEFAGFSIDVAKNTVEGLEMMQSKKYDLVLLDIMMFEGPSGLDILRIVRSDPEKYGKPIIVMLTNLKITDAIRDAFENGADGYLVKLSLTNDQLVNKVKGYLFGFNSQN